MTNIFNGSMYLDDYLEKKIDKFRINLKNKCILTNQFSILKSDYDLEVNSYVSDSLIDINFSSFKLEYVDINPEINADFRYYSFELKGDLNLFFCILNEENAPIFESCQINTNQKKLYINIVTNPEDNKDVIAKSMIWQIAELKKEMSKRIKFINDKTTRAISIIRSLHETTNDELLFESRLLNTIKKQLNL